MQEDAIKQARDTQAKSQQENENKTKIVNLNHVNQKNNPESNKKNITSFMNSIFREKDNVLIVVLIIIMMDDEQNFLILLILLYLLI